MDHNSFKLDKTKTILDKINESKNYAIYFTKNQFEPVNHFYSKVLGSKINKTCYKFFKLTHEDILARYSRLNPLANLDKLKTYLTYETKYFKWSGCDLFKVIDKNMNKKIIVIETNSCPSGIKSIPFIDEQSQFGSYKPMIENLYEYMIEKSSQLEGDLAVIYDQNIIESSGYCTMLAEISNEKVWLVEYLDNSINVKWLNGLMYVRDKEDNWHLIRACLRFVTQQPWKKIPLNSKTIVINPIIACLLGGRNKIVATKAYEFFNIDQDAEKTNLKIHFPYTLVNINKEQILSIYNNDSNLNQKAVIKVPYDNCGQGVYTVINEAELSKFMDSENRYEKFVMQSLISSYKWASGEYFHLGTLSNVDNKSYVYDIRMIVCSNKSGFFPLSVNCRRARKPLVDDIDQIQSSWECLGTNLSVKLDKNLWETEQDRLLIMNEDDFSIMGLNIDDLIECYIQTVLSVVAIDNLCVKLYDEKSNRFDLNFFKQLNPDQVLINEFMKNE